MRKDNFVPRLIELPPDFDPDELDAIRAEIREFFTRHTLALPRRLVTVKGSNIEWVYIPQSEDKEK